MLIGIAIDVEACIGISFQPLGVRAQSIVLGLGVDNVVVMVKLHIFDVFVEDLLLESQIHNRESGYVRRRRPASQTVASYRDSSHK